MPAKICITFPSSGIREGWTICIPLYVAWPFWGPHPDPWKDGGIRIGEEPLPIGPEISAIAGLAQIGELKGLNKESQKLIRTTLSTLVRQVSAHLPEGAEVGFHEGR
jgi:hypothetical protein